MIKHDINGLSLWEYGENNLLTVIFVHAFPLSSEMWKHQIDSLSGKFRLIVYDIRGFGASDYGDGHFTIDSHARDLLQIADKLALGRVVACGISMGGYILLRALEISQAKFHASILVDTKSEADNNPAKLKRAEQIAMIKSGNRNEFTETFIRTALSEKSYENNPELVNELRRIISAQKDEAICGALMTLAARTDTTDSLEKIDIQLLIISGAEDKLVPPEYSRILYGKTRNSKLVLIPETGHFPNMENPVEFNKVVESYLDDLVVSV